MRQKYKVFIQNCLVKFSQELGGELLNKNNSLAINADDNQDFERIRRIIADTPNLQTIHLFNHDIDMLWEHFKSAYQVVEAAGGLVTNLNGDTLCIHRRGKWDLPKGKLDPGETIPEAAVREVEEECGIGNLAIEGQLETTWHTYTENEQLVLKPTYWFDMSHQGSAELVPQAEEGITQVKWIPKTELESIKAQSYKSLYCIFDHAINRPKL